jgi:glycolate oxidase FAD binding subunit
MNPPEPDQSIALAKQRTTRAETPTTADDLASLLKGASNSGMTVACCGGGTQQRIGHVMPESDVTLHTTLLNAVVEWEPRDLTACIQAGATLESVASALAEQGQQLAIDAPVPDRATLGGLIATNTSGPRRWLYGSWRDHVIGMQMALPAGELIKSGGRVVKNVQGYDLAKLFIGSLGTLGIITQVNVKLTPLPPSRRLFVARGSLENAAEFLTQVADLPLRVSTLDLLDAACVRRCGLGDEGCAALVLVEGAGVTVDGQSMSLAHLASGASLRSEAIEAAALQSIWVPWLALERTDDLTEREALMTVSTRPSDSADALRAMAQAASDHALEVACWARMGNGIVYGRFAAQDDHTPRQTAASLTAIQSALLQRWPSTTIVSGSPQVQRSVQPWGQPPATIDLMRALKRRFDPNGIMQPGRYVGGV